MDNVFFTGIDIGSSATKAVAIDKNGKILAKSVVNLGAGISGPDEVLRNLYENVGHGYVEAYLVATGYGRNMFTRANASKSELSCHAKAARKSFDDARTVIDIGGQDSKVIKLNASGQMTDFVMNDKCAAGTGRFLDLMSRVLNIPIEQMGEIALNSKQAASISSTCSVFAESEVISKLALGTSIEDIVAGIHDSIARKVGVLAGSLGVENRVIMTGGVARNNDVVKSMEELLKVEISVPEDPQIMGAYGAALFAAEEANK